MNPDLDRLQPYPFQKLNQLFQPIQPSAAHSPISLTIGEPKHPAPAFIGEAIQSHLHQLSDYPTTRGLPILRQTIATWLEQRFDLKGVDPDRHILPVNGTREALFAIAQATVDRRAHRPLVMLPNPFYQIYEGAALLAGAEPRFIHCDEESGLPDFDRISPADWDHCQLLYLCSPGNPTGAVLNLSQLQQILELAERHDFLIASDECYSEIYGDSTQQPPGLLQAAQAMGNEGFRRCLVFHSLSKRSNVPGLRSGFVAGDASVIETFFAYRTYHGCAMPLQHQVASVAAWNDEQHVEENRARYREKFDAVLAILGKPLALKRPDASFYLWAKTPMADTDFARRLYAEQHLSVLPGSFLSRQADGRNPGANRIRMALVAPLAECIDAAQRLKTFIDSL